MSIKVAVDAFGGDHAPYANIEGAVSAHREHGVEILLVGNEETVRAAAAERGLSLEGIELLNAPDVFSMHSQPTDLLKAGKNSSMAVGLTAVSEGKADAFVSAGSTGALVVGGTFITKRIKGVKRAAIGTELPTKTGRVFLMDVGANAECRPEMLVQFGVMATAYLTGVRGMDNPTVGLLNIGTEETKGGELQQESYRLLKDSPLHFIGNVEARELPTGPADAVITDGFTGNIALKLYEGVASNLFSVIKATFMKNIKTILAAALVKKDMKSLKTMFDAGEIGGAPLLGVRAPVIKAHGNSDAKAIKNAILQAASAVEHDLCGAIAKGLAAISVEEGFEE